MSDLLRDSNEFVPLLNAACDGLLDDQQFEELATALDADASLRKLFASHVQLLTDMQLLGRAEKAYHDGLLRVQAELPKQPPLISPIFISNSYSPAQTEFGFFASGWPVAYLAATVIMGIGLTIAAVVCVSRPTMVVEHPKPTMEQPSPLTPQVEIVGRITGMLDCVWGRDGERENLKSAIRKLKSPVTLGDAFALRSGLLEITYDTGAKVILQGPVAYGVESKNGGFMSVGRLTGKVTTADAKGFFVRTPTATITDLGTEFGVEVSREGHTISHVFRGSVKLEPITVNGGMPAESRILHANESAEVAKTGDHGSLTVQPMTVDPATFVRAGELPKLADDLRLKPSHRWQKFSEQLRKEPSLLAYYDFQLKQGEPSVLPNVAANGDKSFRRHRRNATWTTGRMPGKHALLFNGPNDRVRRQSESEARQSDFGDVGLHLFGRRRPGRGRSSHE